MIELKSHQKEGVEFLQQRGSGALFFEMGLGKTVTALEYIHKNNLFPCLIVCPNNVVGVWSAEVQKFDYPSTVIKLVGTKQERISLLSEPKGDIFVINYEGLRILGDNLAKATPRFKCMILDECFIGGTKIKTPLGFKSIEDIKLGETVCNAIGYGKVKHVFKNKTIQLVKLSTEHETIFCTPNHPFFTNFGWEKACNLNQSHCIKNYEQTLSMVQNKSTQSPKQQVLRKILFSEMENEQARIYSEYNDRGETPEAISSIETISCKQSSTGKTFFRKNDKKQSNEESCHKIKSQQDSEIYWAQTHIKGWQRHWANKDRTTFIGKIKRLCLELRYKFRKKITGLSKLLQSRPCLSITQDCNRGRWSESQSFRTTSAGSKERIEVEGIRVVSVENIQQEDFTRYGFSSEGVEVFNLEVEGHPSYVVSEEELVVHNCHRIKSLKSQQTSIALKLSQIIPYRILLTGTPVTKSPEDLWSQVQMIKPMHLGNFWNFRARYIEMRKMTVYIKGQKKEIQLPYRFKNLKELESRVAEVALRKTKLECLDLPDKIYKRIPCQLKGDQLKAYYDLKMLLHISIKEEKFRINQGGVMVNKLRQICQGFIYDQDKQAHFYKNNVKLDALEELLDDLLESTIDIKTNEVKENKKIILLAYFQAEIEQIYKRFQDKYRIILYKGTSEERALQEQAFKDLQTPAIFLCQVDAAIGINLTCSSDTIFYSNTWNYAVRKQAEDRNHRIGQDKSVIYYDMVCTNTIDEHVLNLLTIKQDLADAVTGDLERVAMSYIKGE